MIQNICDRCKANIDGTTYYTIFIYGHDTQPSKDNRVSVETAAQNMGENMRKIMLPEKIYCYKCKTQIESFINNKEMK